MLCSGLIGLLTRPVLLGYSYAVEIAVESLVWAVVRWLAYFLVIAVYSIIIYCSIFYVFYSIVYF